MRAPCRDIHHTMAPGQHKEPCVLHAWRHRSIHDAAKPAPYCSSAQPPHTTPQDPAAPTLHAAALVLLPLLPLLPRVLLLMRLSHTRSASSDAPTASSQGLCLRGGQEKGCAVVVWHGCAHVAIAHTCSKLQRQRQTCRAQHSRAGQTTFPSCLGSHPCGPHPAISRRRQARHASTPQAGQPAAA